MNLSHRGWHNDLVDVETDLLLRQCVLCEVRTQTEGAVVEDIV